MASTIREEDETKEFFDSPEELEAKVSQLADWIRQSKHFIAFTVSPALAVLIIYTNYFMQGAGISTSAGSKFTAGSVGVIHDYDR